MPATAYPPPPPPARFLDVWIRMLHNALASGLKLPDGSDTPGSPDNVRWQAVSGVWGRFFVDGEAVQLMLTTALTANPGPLTGVLQPLVGPDGPNPDRVDLLLDEATATMVMSATLDAQPSSTLDVDGQRYAIELARAGQVCIVRLVAVP